MRIRSLLLLVAASLSGACAQKNLPASFAALQPDLSPGTRVYVTQASGDEVSGRMEALSADALELRIDESGTRRLAEADVAAVAVRDPYWPSVLIGAGAGAVAFNSIGDEGCTSPEAVPNCRRVSRAEGTATFAAIGAGIGFLIDFFKKETIYERRPAPATPTHIGPMVGKGRIGLTVSRSF